MRPIRLFAVVAITLAGVIAITTDARAVSPRNPYRSFNLSGVNYGSMQWERSQRQGKRVWPSNNTPNRGSSRGGTVVVGGTGTGGGAFMSNGSSRSSRTYRRR